MPEGATGSAVAMRKNTSRLLFAPETFNFAEVTRAIEVARRMPSGVECVFAGFSPRNSEHITAAGFLPWGTAGRRMSTSVHQVRHLHAHSRGP